MKPRVAIFGNYGVGNLGDELMLEVVMDLVRLQGADPVVFCGKPEVIRSQYRVETHAFLPAGFRSFLRQYTSPTAYRGVRKSLDALRSVDAVVFGGGGLFVDVRPQAIALWVSQLRACLKLKKKVFLLSQNVSLRSWYAKRLVLPLLSRVEALVVRDRASFEFLESQGLKPDLSPDITFVDPPVKIHAILPQIPVVSVALCAGGITPERREIFREFLSSLQQRYDVQLLVFQSEHDDDRQVYQDLGLSAPVVMGEEVFDVLSRSAFVLGMRYHSLVFALQAGVPFLAFNYQPKVAGFVSDNALDRWLVSLDDMTLSGLREQFAVLEDHAGQLRHWMQEQGKLLRADGERYHRFLRI